MPHVNALLFLNLKALKSLKVHEILCIVTQLLRKLPIQTKATASLNGMETN
jgi:hypothetical protein